MGGLIIPGLVFVITGLKEMLKASPGCPLIPVVLRPPGPGGGGI